MEKNKTVIIFIAEGFEECEALVVADLLKRAGIEVITASITGSYNVTSSAGTEILTDILVEAVDYDDADLLFLPGGRDGTASLKQNPIVKEQCIKFAQEKLLAAICAAPSILAGFGLLDGKEATCHPSYENQMAGAILTGESVAVSGNITTGQGLGAAFPFAFELIRQLADEETSGKVADEICYK